jgi:hypothetical protein
MKTILASSALVAALLFAAAPGAVAQQSGAFCLKGSESGGDNCSFATEAQCKAAMKGASTTESCTPNTNRTTGSGAGAAPKGAAGKGNGTAGAAASGGLEQGGSSGGATSGPNANPK